MIGPGIETALVTGGRGRLGRLVVAALRSSGVRTLSLSRSPSGGHPDDVSADLGDAEAVRASLGTGAWDLVVHLAARVHGAGLAEGNRRMDATIRSLVHRGRPSAVVFASSGAVYGDQSPHAHDESSPLAGTSPYALSKIESETALRALADDTPGLSVTSLRIFNIAGPDFPDSLVQRLLRATTAAPVTLTRPDGFVRDYVHQSDVVRSVVRAIERPQPGYRALNVAAGVPVPTRRLVESLRIDAGAWIEADGRDTASWADIGALDAVLGVRPRAIPTRRWDERDVD